ncbi:hypothetical protein BJ165DRAFT_867772 [Panaeolus papilionaceus]|nr:hypothetical protein BJ165DRAFT_867772 [Panaeolus papilionaceus]
MASDGIDFFDSLGPTLVKLFLDALQREVLASHRQLISANLPMGLFGLFFDSLQFGFELPVSKSLPDDPSVDVLVTWYMHTCCKRDGGGDLWDFFAGHPSYSLSRMRWVYGSQSLFCQDWGCINGLSDAGLSDGFIVASSKAVIFYIRHIASLYVHPIFTARIAS